MARITDNPPSWWERIVESKGYSPAAIRNKYAEKQKIDQTSFDNLLFEQINNNSIAPSSTNVSTLPEGYGKPIEEKPVYSGPQSQTYLNNDIRTEEERQAGKQWFEDTMHQPLLDATLPLRWMSDPFKAGGDVLNMLGILGEFEGTEEDRMNTRKYMSNPHTTTVEKYGQLINEGVGLSNQALINWAPYERLLGPGVQKAMGTMSPHWADNMIGYSDDMYRGTMNQSNGISREEFQSEIDWAKWNKEIPENKALMQEYNAIEQQSKANGTWMKNPDGSIFQGTPEQFVQQNSQNFKNAFGNSKLVNPDGSAINLYHGSDNKFNMFDESLFGKTDKGMSGEGIYTSPVKDYAERVSNKNMYELYGNAQNPVYSSNLIEQKKTWTEEIEALYNFNRKNADIPNEQKLLDHDSAITDEWIDLPGKQSMQNAYEIVFKKNTQLKSATGNNGMFDMTNPNIYKSLLPLTGIGIGLSQQNK